MACCQRFDKQMVLLIQVCQKMLDTPELRGRIQQQETEKFIIRVMVALIILYDHIFLLHYKIAFSRRTHVIQNLLGVKALRKLGNRT